MPASRLAAAAADLGAVPVNNHPEEDSIQYPEIAPYSRVQVGFVFAGYPVQYQVDVQQETLFATIKDITDAIEAFGGESPDSQLVKLLESQAKAPSPPQQNSQNSGSGNYGGQQRQGPRQQQGQGPRRPQNNSGWECSVHGSRNVGNDKYGNTVCNYVSPEEFENSRYWQSQTTGEERFYCTEKAPKAGGRW